MKVVYGRRANTQTFIFILSFFIQEMPFHLFTSSLFKLLSICYFFNIREYFLFSFFVTNHFLQIAKNFRLFGQKTALKMQKHRF
ncbi:hypothetical protein HMPREF9151_01811 [Hoylesella saccharolytica F0055]|uniref:Uncharacterized protein n=1 Tax=Hoylesella saccharolytica F0055 TaxID=1127699 RepID=L1N6W4_9BACT|nr:hypothetical protein HMPREF9151_01811 [Hoylesella saccharolytica F0055]